MKKERVYVDMDGTIVVYDPEAKLEDYRRPGFFINREPNESMLLAVKILITRGYDVYVLSAVYIDTTAKEEKLAWLKKYLPELWEYYDDPLAHIIFTPCGENKMLYIPQPQNTDVLLDDYTVNLRGWLIGIAIKCVNGINWSNRTWTGYAVDMRSCAEIIANTIEGIILIEKQRLGLIA